MKPTRTSVFCLSIVMTFGTTVASVRADVIAGQPRAATSAVGLVSWGESTTGQPATISADGNTPIRRSRLAGVVAVAAYGRTGYALLRDGTVRAWGDNAQGQLGDGTTRTTSSSVQVRGLTKVRAIAAGDADGYALRTDGSVWGWGSTASHRLGRLSARPRTGPVRIAGLSRIVSIAAAGDTVYAVRADGTAWAWGSNVTGQLGNAAVRSTSSGVVRVGALTRVVAVAGSLGSGYAALRDGTVVAWGDNTVGQLGIGHASRASSRSPVRVRVLRHVTGVAAGDGTAYALDNDGHVWAWGSNVDGRLGDQSDRRLQATPALVHLVTGVVSISSGGGSTYAVTQNGHVWGWGRSAEGQLAIMGFPAFSVAVQLPGLSKVLAVAPGLNTDYALVGAA